MATGISLSVSPPKETLGIEYTEDYESASIACEDYRNQSVLILGRGNSALETANAIYPCANFVHLLARSRVRLSWETHYSGDIRYRIYLIVCPSGDFREHKIAFSVSGPCMF